MICLTIVSDIRLYREALAELLDSNGLFTVVGTAFDTESAIRIINQKTVDIVLLDMTMLQSCKLIEQISDFRPNIKIVVLAMTEDEDSIFTCAKAGISGYVSREATFAHLVNTICAVADGELYCPRSITASLFSKIKSLSRANGADSILPSKNNSKSSLSILTNREKQIASLISDGLSNKQIARHLMIEVSTVKNHVHNILAKMGLHSRIQLINAIQQ